MGNTFIKNIGVLVVGKLLLCFVGLFIIYDHNITMDLNEKQELKELVEQYEAYLREVNLLLYKEH